MLKLKGVEDVYYPTSIREAVGILRGDKEGSEVVGGGLDISVLPNPRIKHLIFLDKLGFKYVRETEDTIKIGAMSSITFVENSEPMKKYFNGKIKNLLGEIATELLRNQITFGGALGKREPYSDITTLLVSLKAKVVLSDGEWDEELSIADFYKGNFRKLIKERIIKEIIIDKFDSSYFFSMKRFVRNATDIALLNIAMLLKLNGKEIAKATVAVGSRPKPTYLFEEAEEFLKGKTLSEEFAEEFGNFVESRVDVDEDSRASKEYRAHTAGVFAKRILLEALEA
jgi:CO/xanthine dehydrogenase FAD-binding subunit